MPDAEAAAKAGAEKEAAAREAAAKAKADAEREAAAAARADAEKEAAAARVGAERAEAAAKTDAVERDKVNLVRVNQGEQPTSPRLPGPLPPFEDDIVAVFPRFRGPRSSHEEMRLRANEASDILKEIALATASVRSEAIKAKEAMKEFSKESGWHRHFSWAIEDCEKLEGKCGTEEGLPHASRMNRLRAFLERVEDAKSQLENLNRNYTNYKGALNGDGAGDEAGDEARDEFVYEDPPAEDTDRQDPEDSAIGAAANP